MKLFVASLAAVLACGPALAAGAGWHTYVNPRFGVSAAYPPVFALRNDPPVNGDGQSFRTTDGQATLAIFGSYAVDHGSAEAVMQSYKDPDMTYSYTKATRGWFVLSGTVEGRIDYLRCNLGPGQVVGCTRLIYPAAQASRWAPVVDRVGKSLRIAPVHVN